MDWAILLAGFVGGLIRGIVGFIKYQYSYKNISFKWWYFLLMVGLSGFVGLAASWLIKGVVELDGILEVTKFSPSSQVTPVEILSKMSTKSLPKKLHYISSLI